MELILSKTSEGAFSKVVLDSLNKRAYKIFMRDNHPDRKGADLMPNKKSKLVFAAEVAAYEIIKEDPKLQKHSPLFFGVTSISKVIDGHGNDVSTSYLLDCCYCMSLCEGNDSKLGHCKLSHCKLGHLNEYEKKTSRQWHYTHRRQQCFPSRV
jgi:hypothetical protein